MTNSRKFLKLAFIAFLIVSPWIALVIMVHFYDTAAEYSVRARALTDSVLVRSGVSPDSLFYVPDSTRTARIAISNERFTIRVLEHESDVAETWATVAQASAAILIIAGVSYLLVVLFEYWKGATLSATARVRRRHNITIGIAFAAAGISSVIFVFWRFSALKNAEASLGWASALALSGITFIHFAWLIAMAPTSRISGIVSHLPQSYRLALEALVVGVVSFLVASDFPKPPYAIVIRGITAAALAIFLGSIMMGYLRTEAPKTAQSTKDSNANPDHDAPSANPLIPEDATQETQLVMQKMQTQPQLRRVQPLHVFGIIETSSEMIRDRLLREILSLGRRNGLNLIIGSLTSLAAAAILWVLVLNEPEGGSSIDLLSRYYLPRLSVAVFVELFSFFFLRLYKAGLADIKYYQNELTTIETRLLVLKIASVSHSEALEQLLHHLSMSERNVVLKAGESTIELEQVKLEQQNIRSILDGLITKMPELLGKK